MQIVDGSHARLDLVLINPGDRKRLYQSLSQGIGAVEPPVWVGLMAAHARSQGLSVEILDADAEFWTPQDTAREVAARNPRLAAVIVFGSQPSASTMKMTSAGQICAAIREQAPGVKTLLGGVHVSALPERTLREETVDYVCEGEGPYTIQGILETLRAGKKPEEAGIPGLWYWKDGQAAHNPEAPLIQDLARELPGVAWDLLDMSKYQASNWHCFDHIGERSPYAVIYTSLGCPFKCTFCCINAPFGKPSIRYRDPKSVVDEIDFVVKTYGVKNIKIIDEMFVLHVPHVEAICDLLIERNYDLNIWAYARVDTVKEPLMAKLRKAGFRWLAYGIESASKKVRDGVVKRFSDDVIDRAIKMTEDAGIYIIGNYIFGLPDDDLETMRETAEAAKQHNFEFANFYCAMAYPGSKLYTDAIQNQWRLPDRWEGFAQQGVETLPLPTRHLPAGEVLKFRDQAFIDHFSGASYLDMVRRKFGQTVVDHVNDMLKVKIVRKHAAA